MLRVQYQRRAESIVGGVEHGRRLVELGLAQRAEKLNHFCVVVHGAERDLASAVGRGVTRNGTVTNAVQSCTAQRLKCKSAAAVRVLLVAA